MTATFVEEEIASQPRLWRQVADLAPRVASVLPARGERVAVVGCGTSWFIAQSYARLREAGGHGWTDAFAASEFPDDRTYDRVIAISRSGTTTEVIDLLRRTTTPTVLLTAVSTTPGAEAADQTIDLGFADERSVVQTRFATTVLMLLRAHLGEDLADAIADAETALDLDLSGLVDAEQVTFLGQDWTVGLADEAALKTREAAQFWAESYPAMDYRHGPLAIAQPGRLVWAFGAVPVGLADEVAGTGATFVWHPLDPVAALVVAQRFAVALAHGRGLDPDRPRSLTRSVVLTAAE